MDELNEIFANSQSNSNLTNNGHSIIMHSSMEVMPMVLEPTPIEPNSQNHASEYEILLLKFVIRMEIAFQIFIRIGKRLRI